MDLKWTSKAQADLVRLHQFLAPVNPRAAAAVVQALAAAPRRLLDHPRLGERLDEFTPAKSAASSSANTNSATKSRARRSTSCACGTRGRIGRGRNGEAPQL